MPPSSPKPSRIGEGRLQLRDCYYAQLISEPRWRLHRVLRGDCEFSNGALYWWHSSVEIDGERYFSNNPAPSTLISALEDEVALNFIIAKGFVPIVDGVVDVDPLVRKALVLPRSSTNTPQDDYPDPLIASTLASPESSQTWVRVQSNLNATNSTASSSSQSAAPPATTSTSPTQHSLATTDPYDRIITIITQVTITVSYELDSTGPGSRAQVNETIERGSQDSTLSDLVRQLAPILLDTIPTPTSSSGPPSSTSTNSNVRTRNSFHTLSDMPTSRHNNRPTSHFEVHTDHLSRVPQQRRHDSHGSPNCSTRTSQDIVPRYRPNKTLSIYQSQEYHNQGSKTIRLPPRPRRSFIPQQTTRQSTLSRPPLLDNSRVWEWLAIARGDAGRT